MEWKEQLEKSVKQFFPMGVIAAVLMVILGIVMLVNPSGSLRALVWLIVIGFLVGGIFRIVSYAKLPYWMRQGFNLVIGILDVICCILLIISMVNSPMLTDAMFIWMIGFMFGFYAIFAGINTLCGIAPAKRMGQSVTWLVIAGVLELIAGILLIMSPIIGAFFLMYALGFGFIVGGINLLTTTIDLKNRAKAYRDFIDADGNPFDPDNDPFSMWRNE